MSIQSLTNPPILPYLGNLKPVMTARGWEHPVTGELLSTVRDGASKAAAADIVGIRFGASSYERGDDLSVIVTFNEKVTVPAGSTVVVTALGGSNITLKAAAQAGVSDVVFNKKNGDGTTQETVPDRADTYSLVSQTLGGSIADTAGGVKATGTLTLDSNPTANDTVTINSVVYTFKASVTTTAREVKIGATKEISADNLAAAINADDSAGSGVYGSSTVAHSTVSAVAVDATVVVTALAVGTAANSYGTTDTLTDTDSGWGAATLAGGAAPLAPTKSVPTSATGATAATGTLTLDSNPTADDTVTIDSVVYTFKATVTTTAGQVKIGATKEISADNLAAAINADTSAGSGAYGTSTTAHTTVTAVAVDATVVVTAKTKGTGGNSLETSDTLTDTDSAWGGSTLAGGTAAGSSVVIPPGAITAAEWVDETLAQGDAFGVSVHFDQKVDVTAGATLVVTSTTGNVTLYAAGQTDVNDVVFDKKNDNSTPETVPASAKATGTLTNDGVNVSDGDTVTIGAKTYTFQDTLTNVDGNVKIGASNTASMTNLYRAINGTGGTPGTDYAAATVAHTTVDATNPTGTTVVVSAKTAGTAGNSIATTEVSTHLSWGGAVLSGGTTKAPTTLTVAAQSITGTIVDHGTTSVAASKAISAAVAATLEAIEIE